MRRDSIKVANQIQKIGLWEYLFILSINKSIPKLFLWVWNTLYVHI
jgi:hypothetical protein